jgi:hypothetical protein
MEQHSGRIVDVNSHESSRGDVGHCNHTNERNELNK